MVIYNRKTWGRLKKNKIKTKWNNYRKSKNRNKDQSDTIKNIGHL